MPKTKIETKKDSLQVISLIMLVILIFFLVIASFAVLLNDFLAEEVAVTNELEEAGREIQGAIEQLALHTNFSFSNNSFPGDTITVGGISNQLNKFKLYGENGTEINLSQTFDIEIYQYEYLILQGKFNSNNNFEVEQVLLRSKLPVISEIQKKARLQFANKCQECSQSIYDCLDIRSELFEFIVPDSKQVFINYKIDTADQVLEFAFDLNNKAKLVDRIYEKDLVSCNSREEKESVDMNSNIPIFLNHTKL